MQEDPALSMQAQQIDGVGAALNRLVETGADSQQIAQTIAETCQEVIAALTPIIGTRGVAAMYKRSLHLAGHKHAWLLTDSDGQQAEANVATLTVRLARQTSAEAAAGGGSLLRAFYDLLCSLVGPSLTERLLRDAWAPFSN
jgi:hypothetical protein